jgi:hypothetical protein
MGQKLPRRLRVRSPAGPLPSSQSRGGEVQHHEQRVHARGELLQRPDRSGEGGVHAREHQRALSSGGSGSSEEENSAAAGRPQHTQTSDDPNEPHSAQALRLEGKKQSRGSDGPGRVRKLLGQRRGTGDRLAGSYLHGSLSANASVPPADNGLQPLRVWVRRRRRRVPVRHGKLLQRAVVPLHFPQQFRYLQVPLPL